MAFLVNTHIHTHTALRRAASWRAVSTSGFCDATGRTATKATDKRAGAMILEMVEHGRTEPRGEPMKNCSAQPFSTCKSQPITIPQPVYAPTFVYLHKGSYSDPKPVFCFF